MALWFQTDLENVHSTSRSEHGIKLGLIIKNVRCTCNSGDNLITNFVGDLECKSGGKESFENKKEYRHIWKLPGIAKNSQRFS